MGAFMKSKLSLFVAAIALTFVVSCGKNPFQKDPLTDQPDWVKGATPGVQKPDTSSLNERDVVISADTTFFGFVEGVESANTIHAAVLKSGFIAEVIADNLAEFEGGKFEKVGNDWIFTWNPPINYVPTSAAVETFLRVRVNASDASKVVQTTYRDFPIRVTANRGAPIIVREENFPSVPVREGELREFVIYVRDTEAVSSTPVPPILRFFPGANTGAANNRVDVSSLLTVRQPTQVPRDPQLWRYEVTLDLRFRNLTRDSNPAVFRAVAVSKSRIESDVRDFQFTILPDVATPNCDVQNGEELRAKLGQVFTRTVIFIDPTQKGRMEAINTSASAPAGLQIQCQPGSWPMEFMATCNLRWEVPANEQLAVYDISLQGRNNSPVTGDTKTAESQVDFTIRVVR